MMQCLAQATPVARSPGYLRIRVPGLYRSAARQHAIESEIRNLEHVTEVAASPLTGKVLILFDPSVPVTTMLGTLGVRVANDEAPARQSTEPHRSATQAKSRPTSRKAAAPHTPQPAFAADRYPAWHLCPVEETLAQHQVARTTGLSSAEAAERLRQGLNRLPAPRTRSALELLVSQFKTLPVGLLGISAVLSLATGGLAEALSIIAVLALNGGIGYVTEKQAEATIASLSDLVDENTAVLRDGAVVQTPSSHIVPGDLLVLAPGVHVAADARIVRSSGLSVDESALTGESQAVSKHSAALLRSVALADRTNMVYSGTSVAAGTGLAVVVGTGERTEIGAIQAAMEQAEPPKTPIQKEMNSLGNRLVTISGLICIGVFGLGLLRGQGWLQMLKSSLSLAIAAVPEGLPTVATTALARGLRVMRARQMLIRRLQAVETIGAIHTICFDKTGTLTLNRMAAVAVARGTRSWPVTDGRLQSVEADAPGKNQDGLTRLLQLCVLSNETSACREDPAAYLSSGSSTEKALVRLAEESGIDAVRLREEFPLLDVQLRAEGRNYMRSVHAMPEGGCLIAVKGSPAEVLAQCAWLQEGNEIVALTDERRSWIDNENEQMANRQLRVLGFAYARQDDGKAPSKEERDLVWLGLIGLADSLRAGAEEVIQQLHRAGIRTAMITGDQHATASAIGTALGLANGPELQVLNSDRLDDLEPAELARMATVTDVFARVSPAKKLQIVRALQQGGEVVGMTGDGINDGPALRAADVGIAMGRHGTDLARSAADVVLADDRLVTVLDAIRQGRTITHNIEKSMHFLISSNLSEIIVVLGAVASSGVAPLTPMQLLWINLLSDVLPAIAFAAEPAEADIMDRPPRSPGKQLITNADLRRYGFEGTTLAAGALAAYSYGLLRHGGARAGGLAFNTLVLGQLLHAYSCRSRQRSVFSGNVTERNRMLDWAIGGSLGLQLLVNVLPGLRSLLGTGPVGMLDIGVMLAGAGLPLLINEATKPHGAEKPDLPMSWPMSE